MSEGMPLTLAKEKSKLKILEIDAGRGFKKRLSNLGILKGANIEVLRNDGKGPVIIKVLGSRMLLGRGQADKILVEEN